MAFRLLLSGEVRLRPPRRQSSSFESLPQTDHGHPERAADFDESIVEG